MYQNEADSKIRNLILDAETYKGCIPIGAPSELMIVAILCRAFRISRIPLVEKLRRYVYETSRKDAKQKFEQTKERFFLNGG